MCITVEKRQGTKSREVRTQSTAGGYGDLCAAEVMVVMAWGDESGEAVRAEGSL